MNTSVVSKHFLSMKFFIMLIICCLAGMAFGRRIPKYFGINGEEEFSTRPTNFYSFFSRLGDFDDGAVEQTAPTLPSFPSTLLLVEPNTFAAGLPSNALARNANPNGQGRFLGALIALRALSDRGNGGGGIIINTPLNLTNVNNNTIPAAAAPTAVTTVTAPAVAAPATRIIPFPYPPGEFYDRRSQDDSLNAAQAEILAQQIRPMKIIRRQRPIRRQFRNPYAAYSRIQYLK